MKRWLCLFWNAFLSVPLFFLRDFPVFLRDFPVPTRGFPIFLRQIVRGHRTVATWPSGGGHVTIGRWSRGHRAVVASNLPEKIGFEAGAFPYDGFGTRHLPCLSASLVSFFNRLCYAGPLRCCELFTARCLMARKVMWSGRLSANLIPGCAK